MKNRSKFFHDYFLHVQTAAHLPIHRQNRIDNTHGGTIVSIFKRVGRACPCARRVGNTSRAEAGDRVNLNRCTDTVTATDRPIQSLLLKPHSLFAYTLQHPFLSSSLFPFFPLFLFFQPRAVIASSATCNVTICLRRDSPYSHSRVSPAPRLDN